MRISTITRFSVSVVTRVIDCVAVAGIAMRAFLHCASMRELRASEAVGYWLHLCQSQFATMKYQVGKLNPDGKPGFLRPLGIERLAVCPVPTELGCLPSSFRG